MELYPLKTHTDVKVGNGQILSATAQGVVSLRVRYGRESRKCKLNNVLYVPDLSCNILSVSKAAEKGTTMKFSESSCVIRDANHKANTVAVKVGGLYEIKVTPFQVYSTRHQLLKEDLWHLRYGHLSMKNLQKLARDGLVQGFDYSASREIQFSHTCLEGKQHKSPYMSHSRSKSKEPLELVHSDICGKIMKNH